MINALLNLMRSTRSIYRMNTKMKINRSEDTYKYEWWIFYLERLLSGGHLYRCDMSSVDAKLLKGCLECKNEKACRMSFEDLYKYVWGNEND